MRILCVNPDVIGPIEQSMPLLIDAKQTAMEAIDSSAINLEGEEEIEEKLVAEAEQQDHEQRCVLESDEVDTGSRLDEQEPGLESPWWDAM
jgi:hypothetical protein